MAIRIIQTELDGVNEAINAASNMLYDIEDLLNRGPKQLEAYGSLLKILKSMKRGCPIDQTVNQYAVQGCPPCIGPNEECGGTTCQACWKEYVQTYIKKSKVP